MEKIKEKNIHRLLRAFPFLSFSFLFAPFLSVSGCASASGRVFLSAAYNPTSIQRVAVIDFSDYPGFPGSGRLVSSVFQSDALALKYEFIERSRIYSILKEQDFSVSGVVDPATAEKLGQLLGAQGLIVGSITDLAQASEQTVLENFPQEQTMPIIGPVGLSGQIGIVGYNTNLVPQSVPVTQSSPARAGMAVRMVSVKRGSILWSGEADATGADIASAAQSASSKIVRELRRKLAALIKKNG